MAAPPTIHVLNGPSLNLLGTREPEIYGRETLADIERMLSAPAGEAGFGLVFRQTNSEGALVDHIQEAGKTGAGLILNAAAYTHTSVAVHDALRALSIPVVEVHLSNPFKREPFRHRSYVASVALGVICGFGARGYVMALEALVAHLKEKDRKR
jgi:3-dehydroquinate dehydratase-2